MFLVLEALLGILFSIKSIMKSVIVAQQIYNWFLTLVTSLIYLLVQYNAICNLFITLLKERKVARPFFAVVKCLFIILPCYLLYFVLCISDIEYCFFSVFYYNRFFFNIFCRIFYQKRQKQHVLIIFDLFFLR